MFCAADSDSDSIPASASPTLGLWVSFRAHFTMRFASAVEVKPGKGVGSWRRAASTASLVRSQLSTIASAR